MNRSLIELNYKLSCLSLGDEYSDLSSQCESADLRNVEIIFEY